jgi:hypothetical protein
MGLGHEWLLCGSEQQRRDARVKSFVKALPGEGAAKRWGPADPGLGFLGWPPFRRESPL